MRLQPLIHLNNHPKDILFVTGVTTALQTETHLELLLIPIIISILRRLLQLLQLLQAIERHIAPEHL